jgi:uncharacterized protein (TIGR02246 family)
MTDSDEGRIRTAIDAWGAAFCAKDLDRLLALYAPDAVLYDAIPPYSEDVTAMRRKIGDCLCYFPERFAIETRDLRVTASGDVAGAHWLWRFTELPEDHPAAQSWMRSSTIWQRQGERWLIIHDHCSVPFDPETSKAVFTLEP